MPTTIIETVNFASLGHRYRTLSLVTDPTSVTEIIAPARKSRLWMNGMQSENVVPPGSVGTFFDYYHRQNAGVMNGQIEFRILSVSPTTANVQFVQLDENNNGDFFIGSASLQQHGDINVFNECYRDDGGFIGIDDPVKYTKVSRFFPASVSGTFFQALEGRPGRIAIAIACNVVNTFFVSTNGQSNGAWTQATLNRNQLLHVRDYGPIIQEPLFVNPTSGVSDITVVEFFCTPQQCGE